MSYFALFAMLAGHIFSALMAKHLFRDKKVAQEWSIVIWKFILPFLVFTVIFIVRPPPHIPPLFWFFVFVALPFEFAGQFLSIHALKVSDVSLVAPFANLTPLFLLVLGYVVSSDVPSLWGIAGVFLIVFSMFFIDPRRTKSSGVLTIFKDKGVLSMIGAAFAYSFTAAFARKSIQITDPFTFGFIYLGLLLMGSIVAFRIQRSRANSLSDHWKETPLLWTLGIGATAETFGQYIAMSFFPAAYVIALKRLSALFQVLWGGAIWHEPELQRRLLLASLMIVGAVLILLKA